MKGSGPKFIKLVSAPSGDSVRSGNRPRRICYVDDSRTSAYVTKKILTEFGYHVDHFPSAEPAIVALLESDYDLLLTDLLLSTGGMDGDDLVRFLRMSGHPKKKLMPVIVITGSSDKDTLLKIYEAGANGVLVKPITGEELHDRIRTLIPESSTPGPHPSDYALEIHDEHVDAGAPAERGRRKPVETRAPEVSKKALKRGETPRPDAPPPVARPGNIEHRREPTPPPDVVETPSIAETTLKSAEQETPHREKQPIKAFGAKKKPVISEPERDAAAVIAELRSQRRDDDDEDIPTLTLAMQPTEFTAQPLRGEPPFEAAPQPVPAPTAAEPEVVLRAPHAPAMEPRRSRPAPTAADDAIVFSNDDAPIPNMRPVLDLNAPPPPKKTTRAAPPPAAPARNAHPIDELSSADKSIITALDIAQDFSEIQDEFYQPSISQTIVETIKRYKVLSAAAVVSLLIIGWSMFGFVGGGNTVPVDTVRAELGELHQTISVPGKIVSKLKVDVIGTTTGQVVQVFVKEGDKVRKGQSLVRIENDELDSEVKRAEGNLLTAQEEYALAEKTLTRMRRALDLGAVSRQAVEEAEAGLRSARAKESVAKEQARSSKMLADKLTVTAPIDGTITAKQVQPGQYVKTNDVLFSIVDLGQREIEAKVDAADSASISVGQEVVVSSDAAPDRKWNESVTRIATATNRENSSNTINVYFSLGKQAPGLKLGQQVDTEIRVVSSDRVVKLPIGALIQRNGKSWVAVIENGRAHFVPVTTGMEDLTHVEIAQGIRPGQEVILPKGGSLREGDKVSLITASR